MKQDEVLLKLRRKYSKDEIISALDKRISELEIELGKAESYILELEDKSHQKSLKNGGQVWFEKYKELEIKYNDLKSGEMIKTIFKSNARLRSKIRDLEKIKNI